MESDRKRHCWECLRRSLVCDFTRPACKRCIASGIACPGYKETQPLRLKWLQPGKVKSRKARRTRKLDEKAITTPENIIISFAKPHYELKTDIHTFFQASEYFNARIFPGILPILGLGSNSAVYQITPRMFQNGMARPDYVRLGIVCASLSHRMNQAREDPQSNSLATTFFHYRGLIIRSLNEDIGVDHKRMSNLVVAGILTLIIVDSQQGASAFWRYHLQGARRIIALRGGMRSFAKSTGTVPLLLLFVRIAVMGDTSSPASDIALTPAHLEELDSVIEHYGNRLFAFQGFPTSLFVEIIKINHLRMRAAKHMPVGEEDLTYEAYEILNRIESFSPEKWTESKPSSKREEWMLLGKVHRAAVALYCIHSLQGVSVLPHIPLYRKICAAHGRNLHTLLKQAMSSPSTKLFMLWPLIMLGMEAVEGGVAMRSFVQWQLPELSKGTGMLAPLTARDVLERFWDSGETNWDSCFDRPYAFMMEPAVEVSKLS